MEHAEQIERAFTTQAERLRDPSHTRMLAAIEVQALMTEVVTGFRPRAHEDGELWFVQTFGSATASRPS